MLKKYIHRLIFTVLIITSALAISAHSALASDWVEEGWLHIEQNDVDSALAAWQSGVNTLPASQLLIFTGVYAGPGDAVRQLKRAGKDQRAIILQADFKGESAYYVMSAVDVPADRSNRREKLAPLRKAIKASSWLFGNAARKFQSATHAIESVPATVAVKPVTSANDEESFPINSENIPLLILEDDTKSPVSTAIVAAPKTPAVQTDTPLSADWIQQGWQAIDQANIAAALTVWQQGVNSLPPTRLLIFAGVYAGPADALKQLKRAGRDQQAIILKSGFNGKQAYYVMSAVDVPADKAARREKLATLREAINAPSWLSGNAAEKFQTAASLASKVQETEPKPSTLVIKKEATEIKEETFLIEAFDVQGNTLVSTDGIQSKLKLYLGPNRTYSTLFQARSAIEKLYNSAGHENVAVGLPGQISSGNIALLVFEDDIQTAAADVPELPAAVAADIAISSDWIQQGWQAIDQADIATALTVWQQGVNSLPSTKLLIFTGIYVGTADALKQLKRAGRDQKAIILKSDFNGKQAYYVMSAVDVPVDKTARREKLTALREAINAPGWLSGNAAKKFQTVSELASKTQKAAPKPSTLAVKKEATEIREKTFLIKAFDVQGNTLVSTDKIQSRLTIFLGPDKTREEIILAKRTIIALYRNAGYEMVAVGIPRTVNSPIIPIRVVEVNIGNVLVTGNSQSDKQDILSKLPALKPGQVGNAADATLQLDELKKLTNIKSAQIVYHPNSQGTIDVEVRIDEKRPYNFGIMASNLGVATAGRTLFTGLFHHNNLWGMGHELSLTGTTSELIKKTHLYSAMYKIPFPAWDAELALSFSRTLLLTGVLGNVFDVSGRGTKKKIHYIQTLYRQANHRHYLKLGYEWHRFVNSYTNIPLAIAFNLDIRTNLMLAGYGFESSTAYGDFDFTLDYFRNSPAGIFNNTANYQQVNPASVVHFSILRFSADYSYAWLNGWTFSTNMKAQLSNNSLIAGERLFISGMTKIRGLAEVDAAGDSGYFVRTELTTPAWFKNTRFLAFVDFGRYRLNFPFIGERGSDSIISTGLGLIWRPEFGLDLRLEGGYILNGTKTLGGARPINAGHIGGHFKAIYWLY